MALYKIYNGPSPTTAAQVAVTTGTAIETGLQIKAQAGVTMKVKAWGVSMDGAAAAAGIQWELLETGTVFATVTAHVDAGIVAWDAEALSQTKATYFDVGTADTGFTSSSEGAISVTRMFDSHFIQPTGVFVWEFSLGNEPVISPVSSLRIRQKAQAAVLAISWILVEV